jgi:hypothetical protein
LAGCRIGFGEGEEIRDDAARIDEDAATDAMNDASPDSTTQLTCPGTYTTIAGQTSKYRAINNSMVWLTSEQLCEADGTHLVIIDDAAELTGVTGLLAGQNIWTGVTDRIAVGTFRKVTGPNASYLPWDTSEPDATAAECLFIDSVTLKFADQDCTSGRRAVCECDGAAVDPASY